MRKFIIALLCLFSVCCVPTASIPPRNPVAADAAVTVALMESFDGKLRAVCGAVWVANEWLLTAYHCTTDVDPPGPDIQLQSMEFIANPVTHARYPSDVVYRDSLHDLALLRARKFPVHTFVELAAYSPAVGSPVHVVGHPVGLLWTSMVGQVAQYRSDMPTDTEGPFLQLQVPIGHGNSGGGAFDDKGRLIGIADFMFEGLPSEGFFIPVESIRPFLKASHVL